MKEKVERLAKGVFEYESPNILLSEDELLITVEAGKTYSGSFTIKNSKNTPLKGVLYSSSRLLKLEQDSFTERYNVINYRFIADHMNAGETAKNQICIVSDCGEIQIPVTINTEVPYFNSSLGKIKDLYNFANLAKSDWAEALKLFKSDEFKYLILHYETKYHVLYENLIKSRSSSQALEEFLVAIHKKLRINIGVENARFDYPSVKDSFMDKLLLTKDNWGYTEVRVSTDAPFIKLEHKIIWSDNFVGNSYFLEYVLNTEKMRPGNNFGRIYLKTAHQTIQVEVTCRYNDRETKRNPNTRQINSYKKILTQNYLNFRSNKIPLTKYVSDSAAVLDNISSLDINNQDMYHLLRIHLNIISGKDSLAEQALFDCSDKEEEWRNSSVVNYCGYLYLMALLHKDEQSIQKALVTVREYYNRGYSDWRLLWFLLYTDTRYDRNKAMKLEDIKKQFMQGCRSPILYFEAAAVFNEEPSLLYELGEFELQVLHWGIKNDYLSKDVAIQVTYLAGKSKDFNNLLYHGLALLYEKYKLKDTLSAICTILIKGRQRSTKYFTWFNAGVEEQLRITELHEYYMYSVEEKPDIVLPQSILLYFIYNSNLNERKKAFLYSYVVRNKDNIPNVYQTYYKHMQQFTQRQIAEHNINANLALIYEEIIAQEGLTEEIAAELPFIMFKYEVNCNNPNMKGVFVVHKEIQEEVYTPFVNGSAQVDIYTDNAEILLVDGYDNRYSATVEYTLNKLMHWEDYSNTCFDLNANHPFLLLNLFEKVQTYQKFDDNSVEIRKSMLLLPGLSKEYYNRSIQDLIYYYYDNFEGEMLETYLIHINVQGLTKADRDKVVELFIIRDLYDKALTALEEYGFEGVAINRLIKLCTNLLQNECEEDLRSEILVNLSYYIFKAGKYNEAILEYLVKYFYGTTAEMFELWKAATAFEMDTINLEERLLGQMLFAESYLADSLSVFMQYYKRGCNHKLIKAFLSYNAYKYLVKDRIIQPELFSIMKREVMYEENDVCTLALLREFSHYELLTDAEMELVDYNIHKFVKKGIVLPFFKTFQNKIAIPPILQDKFYVEYKTNPAHKVLIHYRMDGKSKEDDFICEEMKNEYYGIYIKEFFLFYNEQIQYYISEEDESGQVIITESVNIQLNQNLELDEDTRYNRINFMLTAIEMKDEKTLFDSICNYVKTEYTISKIFRPL